MLRKYHFLARTESGTQTEFIVEEHSETIAAAEAKITVERWLADEGEPIERLAVFNLTHVLP